MLVPWIVVGASLTTPAEAGRRGGEPDPKKVEAMRQMRDGSLKVGDTAPDATVVALDGKERQLLADRGAKPVVLVFGSFT
jgi:hypothetical protein